MNILYSGDSAMKDGLLISILSLTDNVREPLHVYVLTATISTKEKAFSPVPQSQVDFLDSLVKKSNPESSVKRIDVTSEFLAHPPTANIDTFFTPYCMLRLYADLVDLPDRLLYMDTDVVCRQDCTAFYHQDMEGMEIAGVLDYYGKWFFKENYLKWGLDYLNSGLLLLNMAEIKRTELFRKCRDLCSSKKLFMPDQSALNKLASAKKIVPERFNEQHRLQPDTVFQHFTTSFRFWPTVHTVTVKPWNVEKVHSELGLHEYDDLLNRYQSLLTEMDLAQ
ncbi:MAG: glycosyl transferase [Bifidobacteriaceae bacterium]|jgi:lipopolysaccharide biosynthesis glycosyltransferase|nr:glycosyl transferase [Bifidobacteriaceae bacterium]MCI1979024.1 glycosyl transferase [Bifidobacteriaceae bacterium]